MCTPEQRPQCPYFRARLCACPRELEAPPKRRYPKGVRHSYAAYWLAQAERWSPEDTGPG